MKESAFSTDNRWLLPEGVDEVLPPRASALEDLRRQLLDRFSSWGYELIIPPFIEFLDSLLTGVGHDLDLQTFKVTDQMSGRMMGVRADMTPQAARIDAHQLKREGPVRLCYIGTVLRTRPYGLGRSRDPLQVGAELFGHAGVESDLEIISLMLETLAITGVTAPHLDIGHVGIFRGLAREANLSADVEAQLFDALQRKARVEIEDILAESNVAAPQRDMLSALQDLNGGVEILDHAQRALHSAGAEVQAALKTLWSAASALERRHPQVPLHFDLAELRAYQYQTGIVFAAFAPGLGQEIARGGRYDEIGKVFGRARPATGFSADLKTLLAIGDYQASPPPQGILVPWSDEPALLELVRDLRAQGERVVWALPGQQEGARAMGCDRVVKQGPSGWQVEAV
ncbi:ATP phosphoribosyltransferase regulatory subunit [Alkalilimnicola ehrlichii]|uniref:ATP phosphoribosyltransferase regulatory subunit n=1 Tax=Alkalilimnicola ehrlichii TaxID=351052 RepID=A0A3E0WYE1_9GAMM|nr:ATP phosphoribosyltransferase regulatory subunit [Alkalilimnicola ehrlichii]RFA30468.1 ATP phosphoribosyltransferase regulatory subunit [Alkalilimnicola ehrlichii]RFA38020.1 ATP phosphoribosyltransferase regulatory subunit [Alkalilimnicola ehrlichii]